LEAPLIQRLLHRLRTALAIVAGVFLLIAAALLAWWRPGVHSSYRLAHWVERLFMDVIVIHRTISDPSSCQRRFSQAGTHLVVATHPSTIHTLALAAWLGVVTRGRLLVVLRTGLPLVPWVLRKTGNGIVFDRKNFDEQAFQLAVQGALDRFGDDPVTILFFPDGSRPKPDLVEKSHMHAQRRFSDDYDAAGYLSGGSHWAQVPRDTGLSVLLTAVRFDTVTRLVVAVGCPSVAVSVLDSWRPLLLHLAPADDLLGGSENLRRGLYRHWGAAEHIREEFSRRSV
jgi:1-acyl-sn-glycerol-3-phosphate acyltransferase